MALRGVIALHHCAHDEDLYPYVGNDPRNNSDPKGLDTFSLAFNLNAFFGGGVSFTAGGYYNTDIGKFGTFITTGRGGGLDISANIVFQGTFGGPEDFFGNQFGSALVGLRGPLGGGLTYGPNFNPTQVSTYLNPTGSLVSLGFSAFNPIFGAPVFAPSVQQSTTYDTTAAALNLLIARNSAPFSSQFDTGAPPLRK